MTTEHEQREYPENTSERLWSSAEQAMRKIYDEMTAYIDQNKAGAPDPEKVQIEALEKYGEAYEHAREVADEFYRAWKRSLDRIGKTHDNYDENLVSED